MHPFQVNDIVEFIEETYSDISSYVQGRHYLVSRIETTKESFLGAKLVIPYHRISTICLETGHTNGWCAVRFKLVSRRERKSHLPEWL